MKYCPDCKKLILTLVTVCIVCGSVFEKHDDVPQHTFKVSSLIDTTVTGIASGASVSTTTTL